MGPMDETVPAPVTAIACRRAPSHPHTHERLPGRTGMACATAGIDAEGARLLRIGSNAVYRLKPPVIVRISRPGADAGQVRRTVAVARWLESAGYPAAMPWTWNSRWPSADIRLGVSGRRSISVRAHPHEEHSVAPASCRAVGCRYLVRMAFIR